MALLLISTVSLMLTCAKYQFIVHDMYVSWHIRTSYDDIFTNNLLWLFATVDGGGVDMKYDARNFITTNGQQLTLIVRDDGCYLCANDIVSILPQFNRSFLEKKRGMRYVNANRLEIELLKQRGLVAKKACRAALYSAKTIVDICYSSAVQPPSFLTDFACEKVILKRIYIIYIYIYILNHIRTSFTSITYIKPGLLRTVNHSYIPLRVGYHCYYTSLRMRVNNNGILQT